MIGLFALGTLVLAGFAIADFGSSSNDDDEHEFEIGGDEETNLGNGDDLLDFEQLNSSADNTVMAGDGDDTVLGGGGVDVLFGEEGEDLLDGGDESDLIYGGEDEDTLIGGEEADLLSGGEDDDTLSGDEGEDILIGGEGNDRLEGGEDDDLLVGGVFNQELTPDTLVQIGTTGQVPANLELEDAFDGNDTLDGGEGDDTLVLSSGDVAEGGAGDDVFLIDATSEGDDPAIINDYNPAEDQITVEFEGRLVDTDIEVFSVGDDALIFESGRLVAEVRGAAGQLRLSDINISAI